PFYFKISLAAFRFVCVFSEEGELYPPTSYQSTAFLPYLPKNLTTQCFFLKYFREKFPLPSLTALRICNPLHSLSTYAEFNISIPVIV
ncbi:hypothetical protein PT286_00890, partial [Neisseriaceae bacterium ESL0693]|nr:hypothetical protein [Neisseriaceae bacterium ESL0693]